MIVSKNKMYQSILPSFTWLDRKDRNARGEKNAWVRAKMKEAARKIRRRNKHVNLEE